MKNNPYVGPRPYERRDRRNFYGRDREARELRALLVAEREVLFYAQSGAGKTSLLNAMVIPALEEKGFRVLPIARVGSELPPGIEPEVVENIFVFSALMALAGEDVNPKTLSHHTLRSFLEEYYSEVEVESAKLKSNAPLVLIFDQFEELFTAHQERWQDAQGFFLQVREALDELPRLGVVFAMREDHVAALDPYTPLFPRRLRARFRMERMGPKGALAAVTKPALNAGCTLAPKVAERLVDDLRRIKTYRAPHSRTPTLPHSRTPTLPHSALGPFVEPVQLQVVCHRMWENLPEQPDHVIRWEEVEKYGNVDRALTDFYEASLAQVMRETARLSLRPELRPRGSRKSGVRERQLRRWFDEQLITPMQTRGLAMQGREETAGLPNAAVDVLEKLHLIRADVRAGARWYELTHDRFIEPIQESNRAWNEQRRRALLTALGAAVAILVVVFAVARTAWQRVEIRNAQSELWISLARNRLRPLKPGLSVSGAQGSAGTIGAFVRDVEGGFYLLSASDVLGPPGLKQDSLTLQPGRTDGGQVPDDVIGYSALTLLLADRVPMANMAGLARLKEDTAFETSIPGIGPIRGVRDPIPGMPVRVLGRTSGLMTGKVREAGMTITIHSDQGSFQFVNGILVSLASEGGDGGALVVDDEGYAIGIIVAGSRSGTILAPIQDVLDSLGVKLVFAGQHLFTLRGHEGRVLSAEWLPDSARIATGGQDGVAYLWDAQAEEVEAVLRGHAGAVTVIAIGPDGDWLATGSGDTTVRLWDLTAPDPAAAPIILRGHELTITAAAISPDGDWLVTGSEDTTARLWDLTTPDSDVMSSVLRGHESGITTVAISPDGHRLATGSRDGAVWMWNLTNLGTAPIAFHLTGNSVIDVAFNPDGSRLTTTSADAKAISWDVGRGEKVAEFAWPVEQVNDVAWSPDGDQVIIVSSDGRATVWGAASGELLFALEGHTGSVLHAAWSPDGMRIVTAGEDGTARIWQGR